MKTVVICVAITGLVLVCWGYGLGNVSTDTPTRPVLTAPTQSVAQTGDAYQPNLRGSDSSVSAGTLSVQ